MIYLITDNKRIKIGKSKDPLQRIQQLQTGTSAKLSLIACYNVPDFYEKRLHRAFSLWRKRGEWFEFQDVNQAISICDHIMRY